MAKAKKTTDLTDLQRLEADLRNAGIDYDVLEYSHAYVDILYRDENGDRVKREFKPDGAELLRDEFDREVGT